MWKMNSQGISIRQILQRDRLGRPCANSRFKSSPYAIHNNRSIVLAPVLMPCFYLNTHEAHMAISACSFRSSSSSSSSSTRCCGSFRFGAAGSDPAATVSLTGTLPVLSISSSSFSCCSSASSSSSSSSSMPLFATPEEIASLISLPMSCCSRRPSLGSS